jgi:hypothetical protein
MYQTGKKLLAIYLGGRAPRCNTELHDVIFVAGESVEACYERIMDKWFGNPLKLHIDVWMELRCVDGHCVSLKPSPPKSDKKLYFINLGAYTPGQFTELHANAFMIANSEVEVKKRAKAGMLVGTQSVHTDDLYDVDDCLEISEVDGQHVHLEPTSDVTPLEPHCGYQVFPPEVLAAYAAKLAKRPA